MMRYCIAEGHRAKQREFLAQASSISLQQDARGNRFLHRFKACNDKLKVMGGRDPLAEASDHSGPTRCSWHSTFCTTRAPPSYGGLLPEAIAPRFHESIFRSIVPRIEAMAADAAADEQLAVRELAGIGRPNPVELKEALIQTLPSLKAGPFIVLNQILVFKHESNIQVLSQADFSVGLGERSSTRSSEVAEPAVER